MMTLSSFHKRILAENKFEIRYTVVKETMPYGAAMVLARLAQGGCHGHDFSISSQQAFCAASVACYELDFGLRVHSVRCFHFRMDHATVLRNLRYLGLVLFDKTERSTIR
jgi:hypothetical protein